MKYFSTIPTMNYEFPNGKIMSSKVIFISPDINIPDTVDQNTNKFTVQDGISPDKTSKQFYQNSDYFWSLLSTNNIVDFYKEWPTAYSEWEKELYKVNSEFTIYSKFIMPVKIGDLVCKYLPDQEINFDKNNYGAITAFDPFYRTFDVLQVAGKLEKNNDIIILRKNGTSYTTVYTPEETEYQPIIKIIQKLESVFEFQRKDVYSGYYTPVSPYYSFNGEIVNDSVMDLSEHPDTILWKYMNDTLENNYKMLTFKQSEENKWTFRRSITVVPKTKLNEVITSFIESVETQKVAFE